MTYNTEFAINPIYQKYANSYNMMNNEQKHIWDKYFKIQGGCGTNTPMSSSEYLDLVYAKAEKMASKEKALSKLGIDEDEVQEIPPFSFGGFVYKDALVGANGFTNLRQETWLMFSDKQVYLYIITFDMLSGSIIERCEEYFYKDVTNITTLQEDTDTTITTSSGCGGLKQSKAITTVNSFKFVVPGEQLICSIETISDDLSNSIKAAKNKLREKKNS